MASNWATTAFSSSSSSSPTRKGFVTNFKSIRRYSRYTPVLPSFITGSSSSSSNRRASYNTLVFEAVRLLGPSARFDASKLDVVLMGIEKSKYSGIIPRTYVLSHCDFTANLTLTISNVIGLEQLKGWYNKDDVVIEWKEVQGNMCLHVHCYVSGPKPTFHLAAEFRYHIFSKEMPLVLKSVLHGDSELFEKHPELMNALVWVHFHSSSKKYNRMECWGALKDAAEGIPGGQVHGLSAAIKESSRSSEKLRKNPKSIFRALFTFLL